MARWRMKAGAGKLYPRHPDLPKVVRPGDEVTCPRAALGAWTRYFEVLEETEEEKAGPEEKRPLSIVHRGGGWYDVIHEGSRRAINDKPLRKEEAEAVVYVDGGGRSDLELEPETPPSRTREERGDGTPAA